MLLLLLTLLLRVLSVFAVDKADLPGAESVLAEYKSGLTKSHNLLSPSVRAANLAQNFLLDLAARDVLHHCPAGPRLHNVHIAERDNARALLIYRFKTAVSDLP